MILDRYPSKRRVIANLKSGEAFRGILWQRTRDFLMLKSAELIKAGGETVRMDGEVLVERQNLSFLQVLS